VSAGATAWKATQLAAADHVAVALAPIAAGERVDVCTPEGIRSVTALDAIPLCHKIALCDVAPGASVLKYGQPIGEATQAIRSGAWVHTHNLASRRARRPPDGSAAAAPQAKA
jgi:altronate hydrolase